MKSLLLQTVTLILLLSAFITHVSADVVCAEDELIRELREDIADNGKKKEFFLLKKNLGHLGKLDCLREIIAQNPDTETDAEKAKRLAAEWNGDCSFEAEGSGFFL